jgi:hypothetical protein
MSAAVSTNAGPGASLSERSCGREMGLSGAVGRADGALLFAQSGA